MLVTQVYNILNTISGEMLGDSVIVNEDLSNVVDIGNAILNVDESLENYTRKLHDHIGKMVFVDRVYNGRAPRLLMDGWEFGSILEKVRGELPEASENESWLLEDGTIYEQDQFTAPKVSAKFFNKRITFEIPMSITRKQVMSAFANATQLNAFYSMIQTNIQNSMTIKTDALIMRTVNAGIAETVYSEFPNGNYAGATGVRAVNLLYLYNQTLPENATPLTAEQALRTPEFIRFASLQLALRVDRLGVMSNLFNAGGSSKFTPRDRMHILMLSEFKRAADVYLQSDTFHDEFTRLPEAEPVTYWQGSGIDYGFDSTSNINVVTPSGHAVNISGVVAVMFDRDAMAVTNQDPRVTNHWNSKAEFWNEWHKYDAQYLLDMDENIVVFYLA